MKQDTGFAANHSARTLSGGRCRGSPATLFQFLLLIHCQPHPTSYFWWPSKFNGHKWRKNEVIHFEIGMFDLVFLELWPLNLRVTVMNNLRPLPVSMDVGNAALSTSVQNVETTCSRAQVTKFWTEVDSAALPTSKIRVGAVDYSWKLHENSTVITWEKWGQTFRDRNVWPRFSWVRAAEFACNFHG